jgi:hypothetical protein
MKHPLRSYSKPSQIIYLLEFFVVLAGQIYVLSTLASFSFDLNNVYFLAIVTNTKVLSALMCQPVVSTFLEM